MTLDEAIAHEKELAKEIYVEAMLCHANPDDGKLDDCIERGKYHEQLAERLEELKFRRILQLQCEKEFFAGYEKGKKEGYTKGYADGSLSVTSEIRNKVIDECLGVLYRNAGKIISIRFYEEIFKEMEQLKAGGENENYNKKKSW